MKKLFLLIILSSFISNFFAMSQTKQPDFAYPKTVSADAETMLKKAIKADNTQATVDALIQYSLAQTSISPDNASSVVDKIESVITSQAIIKATASTFAFAPHRPTPATTSRNGAATTSATK
jgi:hypothetical protein